MQNLSIFKPGRHTAVNGAVIDFTEDMLRASAAAYDTALHEAPLVVGHPTMDGPAYGWARALDYADTVLVAEPDQVEPQFAEMVNAGRFKKISASFYLPDAANNPVPGVYYLRHIGFLGAAAPAVKGLKSASFADAEEGVVEFADVSSWHMQSIATVLRGLREFLISKFTIEDADRAIPGYFIEAIEAVPEATTPAAAYVEQPENAMQTTEQLEQIAAREAKLKADSAALEQKAAAFAEREAKIRVEEEKNRRVAIAEFVDGLIKAGKVLPRDNAGLVAYMAGPDGAGVIEFGEGDDKKSVAPAAWLQSFLAALPKQVDYQERSADGGDTAISVNFAAPPGYSVDPAGLELHSKAIAYQAAHPNTSYDAAIDAVK